MFVIETGRFDLGGYKLEHETREAARAEVERAIGDMYGCGWSTCPPSHDEQCKWRKVSEYEWKQLGYDSEATDRWMHRTTRTDIWHRERIWIRPVADNSAVA